MEKLIGEKRYKKSQHEARRERRQGRVPGILYGKDMENILFEVGSLELDMEISRNGDHGLIQLNVDGIEHRALIREVQRDPVNRKIIHIDLQRLSAGNVIQTEIPLHIVGEDLVCRNGGVVQKEKNNVKVQCSAEAIPKVINIDVSKLHIGNTFRVKDVEFATEIICLDDPNTIIVAVTGDNTDNGIEGVNTADQA